MAERFLQLSKEHRFGGSLLTLGRQWVLLTIKDCDWLIRCGILQQKTPLRWVYHPTWRETYIHSEDFFRIAGFSSVESLDVSSYENPTYQIDLNKESVPDKQFDFILDGSTIEHVFHLPNTLRNIYRMLNVDGRVLHISPADGCMNEGFYQLSPCFFEDYYLANGWQIERSEITDDEGKRDIVLVRKLAESTADTIPFQSRYTEKDYWRAGL